MRLDRIGSAAEDSAERRDGPQPASEPSPTSASNVSSSTAGAGAGAAPTPTEQWTKDEPAVHDDADHHTIVDMSLRTGRYIVVLVIGLGFALAYAIFSFKGTELRSEVFEIEGTSTLSDDYVTRYSSISGPIMFAVSKILEFYLETLVFPTLLTYLHNCSFFPGDQPQRVESKAKANVLYWAFKTIFILINVGLASLYVSQLAAGIDHSITLEDLMSETNVSAVPLSTPAPTPAAAAGPTRLDAPTAVENTLLRSVVSGYAAPFELRTQCGAVNQTEPHARLDQVEATSLSLAFPMSDWNSGLLADGLPPSAMTSSLAFTYGEYRADPAKYERAAVSENVNVSTAIETFILGASLLERTLSNMNLNERYKCSITRDNQSYDTLCPGVRLDILNVLKLLLPGNSTFPKLVTQIASVASKALNQNKSVDAIRMGFATYNISNELALEAMTLDIPLEGNAYALDKVEYDATNKSQPVHFLDADECGADRCVYKTFNTKALVRNEVLLTPFLANCTQRRTLDQKLYAFFPWCTPVQDAVMTYGVGSYITADSLELDATKKRRKLVNPKAFLSLSFGKLSWKYTDLHTQFGTGCSDGECLGLSLPLDNGTSVLLVGKDAIARDFNKSELLRPLRLLSLNAAFVPLLEAENAAESEFAMSVINPNNIGTIAPGVFGPGAPACDSVVDSYIQHVEQNHFYMEKPLQTMYTAALYYLLQNGVATELVHTDAKDLTSPLRLNLEVAMEVKEITFSVSGASAAATIAGCAAMCLLAVALIFLPTARVKQSPNTTPAAQYVQILTDGEMYPDLIHKKRLRFENGDALLMNEYVVDNIVLHAKRDSSKKIYL